MENTVYAERKEYSIENYQWGAGISERSVGRIMKKDVGLCPYKKVIEPLLSNDQKIKRSNGKTFANCLRTNFRRGHVDNFLFR